MKYDIDSIKKRKSMTKIVKIIFGIILIILIYNIILVGISAVSGIKEFNLFGYKAFVIVSDSMEDTIKKGDIVIVRNYDESELNENDIITFSNDGQITTHRITQIKEEDGNKKYVTKGDNNDIEDSQEVLYDDIYGKLVLTIPMLGNIFIFMQDKLIFLIIILIILLILLYKMNKKEKSEIRREKKEIEKQKNEKKKNK